MLNITHYPKHKHHYKTKHLKSRFVIFFFLYINKSFSAFPHIKIFFLFNLFLIFIYYYISFSQKSRVKSFPLLFLYLYHLVWLILLGFRELFHISLKNLPQKSFSCILGAKNQYFRKSFSKV